MVIAREMGTDRVYEVENPGQADLPAMYYMVAPDPDSVCWYRGMCVSGILSWDNTIKEWQPDCGYFNEELLRED